MISQTLPLVPEQDVGGSLFVGAGPAGLAPLVWAARTGALASLAARGLAVVEASNDPGAGSIGHSIHSDTSAATFLECLENSAAPQLTAIQEDPSALRLAKYGQNSAPLVEVGDFLRQLGQAMVAVLQIHGVPLIRGRAISSHRTSFGWNTIIEGQAGEQILRSRSLVLATGAAQSREYVRGVEIGSVKLADLEEKVVLSDDVLGAGGTDLLRQKLVPHREPRVAIVGGSHSALSSAWRILHDLPDVKIGPAGVRILHRSPLRPFYPTPADAIADGYLNFGNEDVCPLTGRLFRLAGFRFRARELVRQALNIGDAVSEPRLALLALSATTIAEAEEWLRKANVIIAATGYRPRALPLFDQFGGEILLASNCGPADASLVNSQCEVLDHNGESIPDVYAIGLAAGFRPSGNLGGEPSFQGQTNGLWLWQNGVGEQIVKRLLK